MLERLYAVWRRVRNTMRGSAATEEMDEELQFHLDMAAARNERGGMSAEQARREAVLRFGGVDRTREAAWDVQRSRRLEDVWRDVRHALRLLRRSPAFALTALATLALGIGANTAIFSVLDAVLLRPLPYAEPARLISYQSDGYDLHRALSENARSVTLTGAYTYSLANVTDGAQPERVWTLAVSSTLLPTLGVKPLLGRGFTTEDDVPNSPPRVLLRHGFWMTQFGGDRSLVGRTIEVNGRAHEVIGVLPEDLEFPPPARGATGAVPTIADLWTGLGWLSDLHERGGFLTIARLAENATAETASLELNALARRALRGSEPARLITVQRVDDSVIAPLRPAVLVFTAGVGLILLIACANLGSLLLARLTGRQRELAVRASLGAPRSRIIAQIVTEGGVLAIGGAIAGIGVAWLLLHVLLGLAPAELARVQHASLSARVLLVTLGLAIATSLMIGVLPAWRVLGRDPHTTLTSTRGATVDRDTGRLHTVLVAAEVSLAVLLLIGGGLLLRSFATLANVSPGFDTEGLVTADVLLLADHHESRAAVLQFFAALEERVGAYPGVQSVSAIDRLPYGRSTSRVRFQIAGRPVARDEDQPAGYNTCARPGYFETMGIPLLEGRVFTDADATDGPHVTVIGRALANRYWPGTSPIGATITVFGIDYEIIGVVGDVRHSGPITEVDPMIYLPHAQDVVTRRMMTIVARTDASPHALMATLRAEIRALDAELPISNLRSFGTLRAERTASQRFNALLVASFASLAVLLAIVGIYGVMSFVVAQRTREIGVRMALGATRSSVLLTFLRHALRAVLAGTAAGLAVALLFTRFMRSLLYGIEATDPATYIGVMLLVGVLACAAAWLPARRAARVEPSVALIGD